MKISYNWLNDFLTLQQSPEELSLILTRIGLEVESVEQVQAVPGGLEGLLIGEVLECRQHPNADRLRVTLVNLGQAEPVQIVCGAPNVAAGQKVVVAPVGATVHPTSGEPFKINKSKIRGEVSEGMICAEDEIGLGQSHAGIMVLPAEAPVGEEARNYFQLKDDYLIEIGLTPNRADAASHLGVARDLAAYLRLPLQLPDLSGFRVQHTNRTIPVRVADAEACPRYSSLSISGVEVKDSPDWLKERLAVIGLRPINNIVDITNYVLHELGQPLHAFDADKITSGEVVVQTLAEGTVFTTLDEVKRKLDAADLMICNGNEPMCLAGVFGGAGSGVSTETKTIFLESAWFNPVSIRKSSKRHGLKTDASFRFERGSDPEMTVFALKRAALLIQELAGGEISSEIADFYPQVAQPFAVRLRYKKAHSLIGKAIPSEEINKILSSLLIQIVKEDEEGLDLLVPPFRVDVQREVDVIEEILRIYGYDQVEIPQQIRASLNYRQKPDKEAVQQTLSDALTANGFYEILSNSLTSTRYLGEEDRAVRILNPLSSDLEIMRQTLLYSGLEAIAFNINRRNLNLKFYEFGKVYHLENEKDRENQRLSIFITGRSSENWNTQAETFTFYTLKALVDGLFERLGIGGLQYAEPQQPQLAYGLSLKRGEKVFAELGAVGKSALKLVDVDQEVFYADIDFDQVMKALKNQQLKYTEVSKFPAVRRDLSMLIDTNVSFADLERIALKTDRSLLREVKVFDVYQGDKLPKGKKSYALSFVLQDEEKTLTDKQIEAVMKKLIYNLEKEAGAEIRKA